MVDDERKVGGRSFQTRGPETAKLHDPYVIVIVLGTTQAFDKTTTVAAGTHISVRKDGHL